MPLPITASIAASRARCPVEARPAGSAASGAGIILQPRGGDDPERPLGADQQRLEVVAGDVLAHRAADPDELAGREHELEPGDPGARHPVLERVRPAGVGGDVAADLRLLGGAGIGRKQQPVLARAAPQVSGDHARLDRAAPQPGIEMSDFFQALEAQDDAAIERDGAAGEAGAAAAGDDRDVVVVAPGDGPRDLLRHLSVGRWRRPCREGCGSRWRRSDTRAYCPAGPRRRRAARSAHARGRRRRSRPRTDPRSRWPL